MPGPLVIREGLAVQSFENSSPQSSPCIVSLTGGNMHVNIQYHYDCRHKIESDSLHKQSQTSYLIKIGRERWISLCDCATNTTFAKCGTVSTENLV